MAKSSKKSSLKKQPLTEGVIPLVEQLELRVIRIIESETRQSITRNELPDALSNHFNIKYAVDANAANQVNGFYECIFRGLYSDSEEPVSPRESPIFIRAVFHVAYLRKGDVKINDDELNRFGQTTGVMIIWPYWREFVQSTMTRMGQPTLSLPLIQGHVAPQE